MPNSLFFFLLGIALLPDTPSTSARLQLLRKRQLPEATFSWSVAPDNRLLASLQQASAGQRHPDAHYILTVRSLPHHTTAVTLVTSPDPVGFAWSPDSRLLVVCSPSRTTLFRRPAVEGQAWTSISLAVRWDNACFFGNGASILGVSKREYGPNRLQVLTLSPRQVTDIPHVPAEVAHASPLGFVPLGPTELLLPGTTWAVSTHGTFRQHRRIGTNLMYDLVSDPILDGWVVHSHQPYAPEGATLVMSVRRTELRLVSLSSARSISLAWPQRRRVMSLQTVGKDILWLEPVASDPTGPLFLEQYRIPAPGAIHPSR